jgi:hypothetical protein
MVSRLALAALLFLSLPMAAATYTVTSEADSGPGTLRQAILDANANAGRDQIVLAANVFIVSSLPDITGPIDISGVRTATSRYTIDVLVSGSRLTFVPGSDGSTVHAISFGAGPGAIRISASNVTVTNAVASESLVTVSGNDNTIGGPAPIGRTRIGQLRVSGDRNVILRTTVSSLQIFGAEDVQLGTAAGGNEIMASAVILQSPSLSIRNNDITASLVITHSGGTAPGPTIIGNTFHPGEETAITLDGVTNALISDNTIAAATGIVLTSSTGVEITGNSIVATGLAIDLGQDGPTPNDPAPDADLGANSLQNFPLLTSATLTPGSLVVQGTLTSAPLTPYHIELFSNDAANPDTRTFLGAFDVTTDAAGNAAFTETITTPLPVAGEVITATATNRGLAIPGSTPNSTSEVSAPVALALPGGLGFATAAQSVDEGAGMVTILVTRTGGSEGTVTVAYATFNGTATAPGDYTSTSGTLTFGDGVTEQTIVVPITNDVLPEPDETFTITLSDPTGGATLGTSTTTITITDADAPVAAQVPTASTWALIAMALGLAMVALLRR